MKYASNKILIFTMIAMTMAPSAAQAAIVSSGHTRFSSLDEFGFAMDQTDLVSPATSGREPLGRTSRGQAALVPTIRYAPMPPQPKPQAKPDSLGVFSSVAISAARLPASTKWGSVSSRDYTPLFTDECGRSGLAGCQTAFASTLRKVSSRVQGMADYNILNEVNRSVNAAMRYRTDSANWGKGDYWANPTEIASKGAGDCEDFAIAKYWLLRSLGYEPEKLQLVVLSDTRRQLYHAVLVAHVNGTAYILDNLSNLVSTDERHANYVPIMSFSGGKSYIHGFSAKNSASAALPTDMRLVNPGEGI